MAIRLKKALMRKVFISYRRTDSAGWAKRLYAHLSMRFGKDLIFQDVEDIKFGRNWLETILQELSSCQVFLVVIGPHWLMDSISRRRLDDPKDVLRMEIHKALSSNGAVIPVLVGAASMPHSSELPRPLKPLAKLQAAHLREEQWPADVEALIEQLKEIIRPSLEDIPLSFAIRELSDMQDRYFNLLENDRYATALETAQKIQRYLDRALPLYPEDPTLKATRGYTFKNEAVALLRLGRYQEAKAALDQGESIFRTMIIELPRDASAWNGLGSIEAVRENYQKAHEYVDEALKISPDYPDALHDHQIILQALGIERCDALPKLALTGINRYPERE